jgi:hypothetical protein
LLVGWVSEKYAPPSLLVGWLAGWLGESNSKSNSRQKNSKEPLK